MAFAVIQGALASQPDGEAATGAVSEREAGVLVLAVHAVGLAGLPAVHMIQGYTLGCNPKVI